MPNKIWNHEIIKELIELSKIDYKDREIALALNGCPILRNHKLSRIQIRIESINEANLYHNALKSLGIKSKIYEKNREVKIFGKENFLKVKSNKLFNLHKDRLNKFINSFVRGDRRYQ